MKRRGNKLVIKKGKKRKEEGAVWLRMGEE